MRHRGFWPALISKGLRRRAAASKVITYSFLACPDFKGIKTEYLFYNGEAYVVSGLP